MRHRRAGLRCSGRPSTNLGLMPSTSRREPDVSTRAPGLDRTYVGSAPQLLPIDVGRNVAEAAGSSALHGERERVQLPLLWSRTPNYALFGSFRPRSPDRSSKVPI